jgi:hypothetical protein
VLTTHRWNFDRGVGLWHNVLDATEETSRQAYLERPHCKFLGTAPMLARIELERVRSACGRNPSALP